MPCFCPLELHLTLATHRRDNMIPVGKLFLAAFTSVTVFGLWKIFRFVVYHQFTSPIRHLRGPGGTSWIYGSLRDILNPVCHGTCHHDRL